MKKFNILHFTNLIPSNVGGVEKFIHYHSKSLSALGHHVHISTKLDLGTQTPDDCDATIIHTHGDLWPTFNLIYTSKIKSFLKKNRVFWIHIAHGNSMQRVIDCREYASISGYKGALKDMSLSKLCDGIVSVSRHAFDETKKYFNYRGPGSIISNGADSSVFSPPPSLCDSPRLIFIGRNADKVKNFQLLIKASEAVFRQHSDFELYVAPEDNTTHTYIKPLGKLEPIALASNLKNSRGLVICSKYEGDPLVVREAMATGIPVIASDIPALRETLASYPNSFYFKTGDCESLAKALIKVAYELKNVPLTPVSRGWDLVANEYLSFYGDL